jgi:hypothetical protein
MTMVNYDVTGISDIVHCLRPENPQVAFRRTELSPSLSGKESGKICSCVPFKPFLRLGV